MRKASEYIADIQAKKMDETFTALYGENICGQRQRYITLLETFIKKFGDQKVVITRSPGRVNLMGRHIEHRGGAGDHAAMKCAEKNSIVHLHFKPFSVGEMQKFSDKYAILVANSMLQAKN